MQHFLIHAFLHTSLFTYLCRYLFFPALEHSAGLHGKQFGVDLLYNEDYCTVYFHGDLAYHFLLLLLLLLLLRLLRLLLVYKVLFCGDLA
jgi:hypothetical protein